jgi:6-hydroxynicotinate 3-monooxygenase
MDESTRIAIVGAGLGGIVAGALLQQRGHIVRLYEQASTFTRLGAGLALGPNVMKILRAIDVEDRLLNTGLRPCKWVSRQWDTGHVMFEYPLREAAEARFGATYLLIHRGDFHEALTTALRPGTIEFGKRLKALRQRGDVVHLDFEDGSAVEVDVMIGADGINSKTREVLLGPELPVYSGYVAHRSIIPTRLIGNIMPADLTKWWSDAAHGDAHVIVYFLDRDYKEMYIVTSVPEPRWNSGTNFVEADLDQLRAAFVGFHPEVQRLLQVCPRATKWPLYDRPPLPLWSEGRIALLGDACHPMKPHMGQGAAMAIEDAAILVRCLELCGDDYAAAFKLYETSRKDRTSLVQEHSRENKWLRNPMDPSWVFDYDALGEGLSTSAENTAVCGG